MGLSAITSRPERGHSGTGTRGGAHTGTAASPESLTAPALCCSGLRVPGQHPDRSLQSLALMLPSVGRTLTCPLLYQPSLWPLWRLLFTHMSWRIFGRCFLLRAHSILGSLVPPFPRFQEGVSVEPCSAVLSPLIVSGPLLQAP